ncbi:unnamed protein product [Allacma fusca]|uniref:Cytochrome P450 n=1 Tax=Allacma fusca TaxID=39272 RepID=A0A8J2J9F5_9HEXA|nr:unnamed protein product [Allacma fusca]
MLRNISAPNKLSSIQSSAQIPDSVAQSQQSEGAGRKKLKKHYKSEKTKVKIWGLPVLGNIHWFTAPNPGDVLLKLGKKYGPVIFTRIGSFNAMILNGHSTIKNACKSPLINGRPDTFYKIITGNRGLIFSDDNAEHRKFLIRRMKAHGQHAKDKDRIIHEEISNTLELLEKNVGKAQDVKHVFSIPTVNVVLFLVLGMRFDRDDSRVKSLIESLNLLSELPSILTRATLLMPWLARWFPKLSGQDFVVTALKELWDAVEAPLIEHDKLRVQNQPRDITDAFYEEYGNPTYFSPLTNTQKQVWSMLLLEIFTGAVETTTSLNIDKGKNTFI